MTVYDCPPISACAIRCGPVFAATVKPTLVLALPFVLLVMASQPAELDALQPQPCNVVNCTLIGPP